jgi:hypothetical protein
MKNENRMMGLWVRSVSNCFLSYPWRKDHLVRHATGQDWEMWRCDLRRVLAIRVVCRSGDYTRSAASECEHFHAAHI